MDGCIFNTINKEVLEVFDQSVYVNATFLCINMIRIIILQISNRIDLKGVFQISTGKYLFLYIFNANKNCIQLFKVMEKQIKSQQKHHAIKIQNNRLRDFVSGLVAGFISVTVCNPLDITRTRLNIMSSPNHNGARYASFRHAIQVIWKEEGIKGFYAGYKINAKAIPIFHSLFFPIYESMKQFCQKRDYPRWQQYLASTIVAGGICNFITNPIWVVRTRAMVQFLHPQDKHYKTQSINKILRQMIQQEGLSCLFKGLSASLLGISNAIIYFYIYQNLKEMIVASHNSFNSYYVFFASLVSKFVASSITYPFIVMRTVMHDHRTDQKMGLRKVIKTIYNQKGLYGFYGGLAPDLIRLLPSNTIVFIVYQYMKRVL